MNFCYHAFSDKPGLNTCSIRSEELPLIVNCSGNLKTSKPFSTDNVGGREDYYLLYLVKGSMTVPMGERMAVISEGDALIFPPRFRYRYAYDGREPLEYFFVHFTGSYAERFLAECGLSPLPFLTHTRGGERIPQAFGNLFEHFGEPHPLQRQELACALERLILTIARSIGKDRAERSLERSLRMIHTAYDTDLRIPDLARLENLSHSRYVEVFRQMMGMPPATYLVRLRVRVACDLLENTDMSVKEIASAVGYGDAHFFSKLFKKYTGQTPIRYRKGP